ncbi:MAG: hypothetical protein SF172_18130 [Burkholderiales bacterium]|nr:hypothetical protein [Burkholderiales bacterium]
MRSALLISTGRPGLPAPFGGTSQEPATARAVRGGCDGLEASTDRRARAVRSIAAAAAVVVSGVLVIGTIMRNQAVLEFDGAEAAHQQRIKSFVAEVRSAADMLRDDRADCSARPAAARSACLRDAAGASRAAVAAARARYEVRRNVDGDALALRHADTSSVSAVSTRPAPAGH